MGFNNECILSFQCVAASFFCPVCQTLVLPDEALQAPCTHLYCKPCLLHIAQSTQACPYDGYLVTEAVSKLLVETNKALAETIGKIAVRCYYHRSGCMWQGPLSECIVHHSGCAFGNFLVICIKCGKSMLHREAEEHAQYCNVNLVYPQMDLHSNTVQGHGQLQMQVPHFQQSHPQPFVGQWYPQLQIQSYPESPLQVYQQIYNYSYAVHGQHQQQQMLVPQLQQQFQQIQFQTHSQHVLQAPLQQQLQSSSGSIPVTAQVLPIQQPMAQQYVQVPQVSSAGYISGLVQGQVYHAGLFAQPQACPPQQLMQHPPCLQVGSSQTHVNQNDLDQFSQPQSIKNSSGLGVYSSEIEPKNRVSEYLCPPCLYQPGSFTFFSQHKYSGSSAPSSASQNHAIACQGFPYAGTSNAGGSDSSSNPRKRKISESLDALKMHAKTCEHKRIARTPNPSHSPRKASKEQK